MSLLDKLIDRIADRAAERVTAAMILREQKAAAETARHFAKELRSLSDVSVKIDGKAVASILAAQQYRAHAQARR